MLAFVNSESILGEESWGRWLQPELQSPWLGLKWGRAKGTPNFPSALGTAASQPSSDGISEEQWDLGDSLLSLWQQVISDLVWHQGMTVSRYLHKSSPQTQEGAGKQREGLGKDLNSPLRAQQSHAHC